MCAEEQRLEPHDRGVARGEVGDRLQLAVALDRDRGHERVRASPGHRVVVDVHEADLAGGLQRPGDGQHRVVRAALGRVELDAGHPLALAEHPGELGLVRAAAEVRLGQIALEHVQRRGRLALLLDRRADGRDLDRGRPAAAADQAGAELAGVRGELGEVFGRRVRVDDAAAGEAREADVRQRGERRAVLGAHRLERRQGGVEPGAVVGADRGEAQGAQPRGRVGRGHAGERLGALVEGQRGDDRERGDAANRGDRGLQLVELVERLDHEQVDAATVQDRGLLGEDLGPLLGRERARVAERADRAGYEDVAARDLARLARKLDARAVDPLELVLEEDLRQLVAVGAERVRLDQVGARAYETRMERLDALRRLEVRLLGAAQTRDCARDERPHAAVSDHHRAGGEALLEAAAHAGSTLLSRSHPGAIG